MDAPVDPPRRDLRIGHVHILSLLLAVVVLDAFLSLVVWEVGTYEFWRHKWYALTATYLWVVPVASVMTASLVWWPWQPFVWLATVGMVGATWIYGRGVDKVSRVLYVLLLALLASGFAAARWSTIGS